MQSDSLVSIVALTWNSIDFLSQCIESVLTQTYPNIEFLVIDNASQDDSVSYIKQNYPNIKIIQNPDNLGFAKAHNLGIRSTKGKYYIPLNPDVTLTATYVEELVKVLEAKTEVGSASGKVYFTDQRGKSTKIIYTTGHLLTKNRKPANRGYKKEDTGQFSVQDYIFGVNGACPIFKREMLVDIIIDNDFFDETFFLYGDDYDLGWRAQLFGWRSIFIPTAIAYHYGKGSGGLRSPYIQYQYARNRYLEIYKNDFVIHFLLDLPFIILYEIVWQAHTLLTDPRRTISHLKAIVGFFKVLPQVKNKRKQIHERRRVTADYIRSLFVGMVVR
jgi:GT2 family glycosyltransferase